METLTIIKRKGLAKEQNSLPRKLWLKNNIHPILGYYYPSTGKAAPVENNVKEVVQRKAWKSLHV